MQHKTTFWISSLCLMTIMFWACSKDEPQVLETDKVLLEFIPGVNTQEFTITTTGIWRIEAEGLELSLGTNNGVADWYTIEPVAGEGNAKITIISKENTEGNSAILKIKHDGKEKTVELKQEAKSE